MKCPPEFLKLFQEGSKPKHLPKKHTLLNQGEVSTHAYYVESGCLRMWYNDDGLDVSVNFFVAGDTVASLESFYLEQPSYFGLEVAVPTVIRSLDRHVFQTYIESSSDLREAMMFAAVTRMASYQRLFLSRIMRNPEERYRAFLQSESHLLDIVPHHYIASYLGMTPVSLSRIRKKVGQN